MKFFNKLRNRKAALNELKQGVMVETQFNDTVRDYMRITKEDSIKNWVVVRYVKKDANVLYKTAEVENSSVKIKDVFYKIDSRGLQFITVNIRNITDKRNNVVKIPIVDIYEGRVEALSHEKWCNDIGLSEEFQLQMYLELKQGIENVRRKKAQNLRQILLYGMIAVVLIVIIASVFSG